MSDNEREVDKKKELAALPIKHDNLNDLSGSNGHAGLGDERPFPDKVAEEDQPMKQENYRILETSLTVCNITDIDTKSRTFRASVEVTMRWSPTQQEMNKLDELMKEKDDVCSDVLSVHGFLKTVKYPKVIPMYGREIETTYKTTDIDGVMVSIQRKELTPKQRMNPQNEDRGLVFYSVQQLDGLWQMDADKGELDNFPFDKHKLPIQITTTTSDIDRFRIKLEDCATDEKTHWVQDKVVFYPSSSHSFDCCMASVWSLVGSDQTMRAYCGGVYISITALRKWQYYLKHVALFVMIQSLLLAPGYAIDVLDVGTRLGYFVTLLLAQTALLYFVKDSLPKLKYYSILDEYIMWNYFLTMVCNAQAAVMMLLPVETARFTDRWFLLGVGCAILMVNLFYLFKSVSTWFINYYRKYEMKNFDIEDDWRVTGKGSRFVFKSDPSCWTNFVNKFRLRKNVVEIDMDKKTKRYPWEGGPCVLYRSGDNKELYPNARWQEKDPEDFKDDVDADLDWIVILFGEHSSFDTDHFHSQNVREKPKLNEQDAKKLEVQQQEVKGKDVGAKYEHVQEEYDVEMNS